MISDALRARMEELCTIMQDVSGIDPMKESRKWDIVSARMMVAYQLLMEGISGVKVAELINKDHSTIVYYKNRMEAMWSPGWSAELELWNKFKNRLKDEK